MDNYSTKLEMNDHLYEMGLGFVRERSRSGVESHIKAIERVSAWACFHHPGRFADGALENYALEIGESLEKRIKSNGIAIPDMKPSQSRTLHLVSTMYGVGGHSRFLVKWVESDKSAEHIIVLTDQKDEVPELLQNVVKKSGNYLFCLPPDASVESRALAVRKISKSCNRVVLHTHPNDSIPVIAFANEGGPPIAMFNHAHFSFNLGSTVSDIIINTIEYYRQISEKHRFAKRTAILAGTTGLWPIDDSRIDKEAAKKELLLPENATVIMSLAHEKYFRPMKGYNIYSTVRSILRKIPDAHMIIVGVKKDNPFVPDDLRSSSRVHLLGYVHNPILQYKACDIFLESFPMPSLGAVPESIAYGEAFPVPVYGPGESILRVQRTIYSYSYRPPDEATYVSYVENLATKKTDIRAEARKMRAQLAEYQDHFEGHLYSLNNMIDGLKHSPSEIPAIKMIESDDCRALADLDQSDIGEKINALLPFIPAIYHHAAAVHNGHQTSGAAIHRIARYLLRELKRKVKIFTKLTT